jgi:hypothetical protein
MSKLVGLITQMQKQMGEMQKVIDQQNVKLGDLEKRPPQIQIPAPAGNQPAVQTPAVPMSDYDFNQKLDGSLGGAQKWLKDLKFGGDLRLRYEAFSNKGTYSDPDRNRFRFRLRYGFEKKVLDDLIAGFSMASGEKVTMNGHNADPTSTNQTMGNLADFKNIWIEKAFAQYNPKWAKFGPVEGIETASGKFNNPFEKDSSDLIFDRDLKPEGAYEKINFKLFENSSIKLGGYATAGQFLLQESSTLQKDAQMFGYQVGVNPVFYTPFLERPIDNLSAFSYYDYQNYSTQSSFRIDQDAAGTSLANGNSVCKSTELCTGFRVLDFYNELSLYPYGMPVRPYAEVTHNLFSGRSMWAKNAWAMGLKVGKSAKKGDWELQYQYKYIPADAFPGAFSDSDFGYSGYNGKRGNVIKLAYKLTDNMTVNLAGFFVRNLNIGQNLGSGAIKSEQQSRFQTDISWKF